VNRSEENGPEPIRAAPEGVAKKRFSFRSRQDGVEFNEISINLRISYKTILLIVVVFDVTHRFVTALADSSFIERLL
jgi:hypothetical protein